MFREINRIREINEDDFEALICACSMYTMNKNSESPVKLVKVMSLNTITGILDKYGIDYVNDLMEE